MNINHPYHISGNHLTAEPDSYTLHVMQMVEQVLFTQPGERVNRPQFGCDLRGILFTAGNENLVIGTQALIQSALQRWLNQVIHVEGITVAMQDSVLLITISYTILKTSQRQTVRFES